jgi:Yip1 domain
MTAEHLQKPSDSSLGFFQIWQAGYFHPRRAFLALRDKPAPLYGFYAILIRSAFISFLWMLPRALMGLEAPSIPVFPFLTPANYYWHAVWIYPVFEFSRWLLLRALIHVVLRLAGKPSNMDVILNIAGIGSVIIEPVVRVWDWVLFLAGWNGDLMFLGLSHAFLAWPWSMVLIAIGYKELLNIPPRWSVSLGIAVSLLIIPLSVVFLRP